MTDFALSARGLKKTYKAVGNAPAKHALKGIDLDVPRGSIFGLLGPNGAGKSTFINILAGMVVKTAGEASIWGFDIDRNPRQARASIGIVPQELSIDPFFTPGEIMELQAGMYGVPERRAPHSGHFDGHGAGRQTRRLCAHAVGRHATQAVGRQSLGPQPTRIGIR